MAAVSDGVTKAIEQSDNAALVQFRNLLAALDRPASVSFSDLCVRAASDWQRAVDDIFYTPLIVPELTEEHIAFLITFLQSLLSWLEPQQPNVLELSALYPGQINSLKVANIINHILLGEGVDRLAPGDPNVDSINYLLGEFPVVVVQNVRMETEHTTYVRNYGGPSFRVAPGLYWRMGQSQGQSSTSFVVDEHAGYLILTNVGLYYSNAVTTLCLPCTQVLKHNLMALDENHKNLKDTIGMILNLRNGKQIGFLIGSAHQSLCFYRLYYAAAQGLVHAKGRSH
ncbi:MAG: hypothetical protein WB992_14210 [Bryobacteraceae bacterium]